MEVENIVSVTEITKYIKERLMTDKLLNSRYIKGEISNFTNHYSGHLYFTLKDENALIKCVMFKQYTHNLEFMLKDGMKVIIYGSISVFEKGGSYQINCEKIKQEGIGDLHKAFEELKAKLEKEGLFDISHKKKIPFMPKTVGVLTSQTGAVIRDIINVGTRRNPNLNLRLLPVPVQGAEAGKAIAKAIEIMNEKELADVLIIARGGGALGDLWPFNEEIVGRAIYNSEIPIISAVGHETDFTIADFVADLRAPTPSAAAELAVTDINELKNKINTYVKRIKMLLKRKTELMRLRYEKCMKSRVYTKPLQRVNESYMKVDLFVKRLENSIKNKLKNSKTLYVKLTSKLDVLSPLKTLTRGYCLTEYSGKIVKSSSEIKKDDEVKLIYSDGNKIAKIL